MICKNVISVMGLTALLTFLGFEPLTNAAALEGSVMSATSFDDTTFNLTDLGTLDWAYWRSADFSFGEPTNSKAGADSIGSATAVGGGNVRGSANTEGAVPENIFTFSDGTTTVSNTTGVRPTGVFNTQLQKQGAGVSLNIDLPTVQTYTVYVWASVYYLNSPTFTAALDGTTSFVSTAMTDNSGTTTKDTYLFTLTATPDNPGDDLMISAIAGPSTGGNSHILISGVAVSLAAVPEPGAAAALAGVSALAVGVLARRRRRVNAG